MVLARKTAMKPPSSGDSRSQFELRARPPSRLLELQNDELLRRTLETVEQAKEAIRRSQQIRAELKATRVRSPSKPATDF
jgi:hypothetical protein